MTAHLPVDASQVEPTGNMDSIFRSVVGVRGYTPVLSHKFVLLLFCSPEYEIRKGYSVGAGTPPNPSGLTLPKFSFPHGLTGSFMFSSFSIVSFLSFFDT